MPTRVSEGIGHETEILTADDFLGWLEPGRFADLIDGEIAMHSPVSLRHAKLLDFVHRLIAEHVEQNDLGHVFREAVAVKLGQRNVFLPDLVYYTRDRSQLFQKTLIEGAPDLAVEILSPSTSHRDVGTKFVEYEQHGTKEYWILDPETLAHRFYSRQDDLFVEFAEEAEVIASRVLTKLPLRRSWLDPQRLPKVRDCLA